MRLGLLGGSFDPMHIGHLWIATFAQEQLRLDRVLLIPASSPPHKSGTIAPFSFRLGLVEACAARRPWLVASDLEADRTRPSYTVDTLRTVRRDLGGEDSVWLLIGADSLEEIANWHQPEEIFRLSRLGVYGRPGHGSAPPPGAAVDWIDGPLCGLSSTLIRQRLRQGRSIAGMVPEETRAAVTGASCYREDPGDG